MDPYNSSIPPATPAATENDSASEDAKAEDRRVERAKAFKQTLIQTQVTANQTSDSDSPRGARTGAPTAPQKTPADKKTPGDAPASSASAAAKSLLASAPTLSPALLRLQAQGYPAMPAKAVAGELTGEQGPTQTSAKPPSAQAKAKETEVGDSPSDGPGALHTSPVQQRRGDDKHDSSGSNASSQDGTAPDPRVMSGPVVLPSTQATATITPTGAPTPPPELLQQMVEFATLQRAGDGTVEFNLGLVRDALGGLRIKLSAYGNRRIGLSIKNGRSGSGASMGDAEVAGLIEALRQRQVEVVDVVVE